MRFLILALLAATLANSAHAQKLKWTYNMLPEPGTSSVRCEDAIADNAHGAALIIHSENGSASFCRFVWLKPNGKVRHTELLSSSTLVLTRCTAGVVILFDYQSDVLIRFALSSKGVVKTQMPAGDGIIGAERKVFLDPPSDAKGFFITNNATRTIKRYSN